MKFLTGSFPGKRRPEQVSLSGSQSYAGYASAAAGSKGAWQAHVGNEVVTYRGHLEHTKRSAPYVCLSESAHVRMLLVCCMTCAHGTCGHNLSHAVTCCHMLSHAVTCRHTLSHAVTRCHTLSHAV
jgi:hypothetical protein